TNRTDVNRHLANLAGTGFRRTALLDWRPVAKRQRTSGRAIADTILRNQPISHRRLYRLRGLGGQPPNELEVLIDRRIFGSGRLFAATAALAGSHRAQRGSRALNASIARVGCKVRYERDRPDLMVGFSAPIRLASQRPWSGRVPEGIRLPSLLPR